MTRWQGQRESVPFQQWTLIFHGGGGNPQFTYSALPRLNNHGFHSPINEFLIYVVRGHGFPYSLHGFVKTLRKRERFERVLYVGFISSFRFLRSFNSVETALLNESPSPPPPSLINDRKCAVLQRTTICLLLNATRHAQSSVSRKCGRVMQSTAYVQKIIEYNFSSQPNATSH